MVMYTDYGGDDYEHRRGVFRGPFDPSTSLMPYGALSRRVTGAGWQKLAC